MTLFAALPWFLVAFVFFILGVELLVSHKHDARAQLRIAELERQQRDDQAAVDEARRAFHVVRGERDLARDTVRNLVDIHRHTGLRPPAAPLPMPPDVDDSLTEEFTQITGRHTWPKWPQSPETPS